MMKKTKVCFKEKKFYFGKLEKGDVFIADDGNIYIKTQTYTLDLEEDVQINAIELEHGLGRFVYDNELVRKFNKVTYKF